MTTTPEHLPMHPSWLCGSCLKPWPCDPAREALVIEYRQMPTALGLYLQAQKDQAREELLGYNTEELDERFVDWVPVAG